LAGAVTAAFLVAAADTRFRAGFCGAFEDTNTSRRAKRIWRLGATQPAVVKGR
jgi:hypothetical protein